MPYLIAKYKNQRDPKKRFNIFDKALPSPRYIGKWQYIYTNSKGWISLIKIPESLTTRKGTPRHLWEIHCLKGNLFKDVERFYTRREAESRIENRLKGHIREESKPKALCPSSWKRG
jgi:hypothetical protein